MPVTVNIYKMPEITTYHGVKYCDVDKVLGGIKRPSGSAGNFDPDWKGFYTADKMLGAIGYATVSEEQAEAAMAKGDYRAYEKAGALLRVDFPGPITIIEINSEARAEDIKKELKLDVSKPLMDQLGDPAIIKSKWLNSEVVILKR